jgi:CIC family chloride channel protein
MKFKKLRLYLLCAVVGAVVFFLGRGLLLLITLVSNVFFHGVFSATAPTEAAALSTWAVLVPVLGGLVIGLIARFGSPAVRGHGIPEVIETVLSNDSRVAPKVALLKPLCSAISIGSGGPFGAEGPVIGLGGSAGSLLGQWVEVSTWERKVLLSAGAAAGITAVFGCPVAAMLLSMELLLFEFSPDSIFAVGLASTVSAILRVAVVGGDPIFAMPALAPAGAGASCYYVALGIPLGVAAWGITEATHACEALYEKLPIHWMWWPAIGGAFVGLIGYAEPRILGPSYASIAQTMDGSLVGQALLVFTVLKLVAWVLALGSGTAGGTLAPLFAVGGGMGALLTAWLGALFPHVALDPRMGALIGMAAVFAGASHALLASLVIALETTHQLSGTLPLLGACITASATVRLLSPHSIMTASLARRGLQVPLSWSADVLPKAPRVQKARKR